MDRSAVLDANVERAKQFSEQFEGVKVNYVGSMRDASAMAAYHNSATGWGFTAQFLTTNDGSNHIHAWVEFVGDESRLEEVVARFKKALSE